MKHLTLCLVLLLALSVNLSAQVYGELSATDAITSKTVSLASLTRQQGLVLVFHDVDCPFAKMYEGRIKSIKTNFQNQGFAFALVRPGAKNDESTLALMRAFVDKSGLNMPYLADSELTWTKAFNISKIPEVIVLSPGATGLEIKYRGAIDNNPQAESAVSEKHLERALNQIVKGETPLAAQVRPVGCNIKTY